MKGKVYWIPHSPGSFDVLKLKRASGYKMYDLGYKLYNIIIDYHDQPCENDDHYEKEKCFYIKAEGLRDLIFSNQT